MDVKKYYENMIGWTVAEILIGDVEGDEFPTLRMIKEGHEDLYADVWCDPEGNGAGHLDLYQPPATWNS